MGHRNGSVLRSGSSHCRFRRWVGSDEPAAGFGGELALAMASAEGYVCPQVKKIDANSARRFTSDEARELNVAEDTGCGESRKAA